jgi:endo-1,4-beta-xylanase
MTMPARIRARALLVALSFGLLPACGPETSPGDVAGSQGRLASFTTLREAAEASGRFFGTLVGASNLSDSAFTTIAAREFDMVTPDGQMQLGTTEPSQQGQFNFTQGDALVSWAAQNGKRVFGHELLTYAGQPSWLGNLSGSALRSALVNHVQKVVGHYQGKVAYWDVAVDAITELGTHFNSNFERTGSDWIEVMYQAAHSADPAAKLCYTDYYIEDWTAAKTQAVYAMIKDFKARGIPIDCVGVESHFTGGYTLPSSFQTTLSSFAALGVEVILSQMDVTNASASVYASAVNACLSVAGCTGITVWGVRDRDAPRSNESPVLFDSSGNKKAAYTSVLAALNAAAPQQLCSGSGSSGVDCIPPAAPANLAWTNDGGTVTLSWTASTNDAGIHVTYDLYFGNFSLGSFDDTRVDLIGFKPGTPYVFTVKARDATGLVSAASSPVTVLLPIPKDTTPPSAPTNLKLSTSTSTTFTFTWTASTDDVGVVAYQIFDGATLIGTTLSASATLGYSPPLYAHSVTVRALDAAGNFSAASPALSMLVPACALGCSSGSSGD